MNANDYCFKILRSHELADRAVQLHAIREWQGRPISLLTCCKLVRADRDRVFGRKKAAIKATPIVADIAKKDRPKWLPEFLAIITDPIDKRIVSGLAEGETLATIGDNCDMSKQAVAYRIGKLEGTLREYLAS